MSATPLPLFCVTPGLANLFSVGVKVLPSFSNSNAKLIQATCPNFYLTTGFLLNLK